MGFGSRKFCTLFSLSLAIAVLTIGCAKETRRLMPTPIGITAGLPYPGEDLHQSCACAGNEVPVFVVSGRNLEEGKQGPDPFGNQRSREPTLGVAYVKIGEGLSPEQLHEETITDRKRKKARVEFSRIDVSPKLENLDPWIVKDEAIRHGDNPWVQAVTKQLDHFLDKCLITTANCLQFG